MLILTQQETYIYVDNETVTHKKKQETNNKKETGNDNDIFPSSYGSKKRRQNKACKHKNRNKNKQFT